MSRESKARTNKESSKNKFCLSGEIAESHAAESHSKDVLREHWWKGKEGREEEGGL